jgi:hypothetical protein
MERGNNETMRMESNEFLFDREMGNELNAKLKLVDAAGVKWSTVDFFRQFNRSFGSHSPSIP